MKRPPIKVTAHNGMDSKNPASSTAVTISVGKMVSVGEPKPPALMMVETTPWMILSRAFISSNP